MNRTSRTSTEKINRAAPNAGGSTSMFRRRKTRIWENSRGDQRVVRRGFSWPAFLFGIFWFIHKKLWVMVATIVVAATLLAATEFMLSVGILFPATVLGHFLFGISGNKMYGRYLRSRGFRQVSRTVSGNRSRPRPSDKNKQSRQTPTTPVETDTSPWIQVSPPVDNLDTDDYLSLHEPQPVDNAIVASDSEIPPAATLHADYDNQYPDYTVSENDPPGTEHQNDYQTDSRSYDEFDNDLETTADVESLNHVMRIASVPLEPALEDNENEIRPRHRASTKPGFDTPGEPDAATASPNDGKEDDFGDSVIDPSENEKQRRLHALRYLQQRLENLSGNDQQISTNDLKQLLWQADCELLESEDSLKIRDWDSNLIPSANIAAIPRTISYLIWTHYNVRP